MSDDVREKMHEPLTFDAVNADDFEELLELRIAAMRESLERIGRFDPERARARLRQSFAPDETRFIVLAGCRVGFYTFRHGDDCFYLDHLYVHPRYQSHGIGGNVLRRLAAVADAEQLPVRLNALRDSASNRFYQHHGFVKTAEEVWDIYYVRWPQVQG